ncbi:bifunctional phosphoribosyl-AMP cyclohydrolase/phosphoribosyl-ATP diphosphatase HisIE [bacterium]|nr:MAG: bifunctional phosphoribosyl-AMP cyclohydrolase/phosphoribosyl-ATP diphosphatase HisIE [bacterium]
MDLTQLDFTKNSGLLPVIVQDSTTSQVLMLGYMNQEALKLTLSTRKVTFFSRSKNRIWVKGESSGNFLHLESIQADCDQDTLLVLAKPDGPTCHTGKTSCFHELEDVSKGTELSFLAELETLLYDRKANRPEGSYTTKMFGKGLDKIAQKVGEEAVETVIASKNEDEGEFVYEASDLLFHLTLLCVQKEIPLHRLIEELKRRHK